MFKPLILGFLCLALFQCSDANEKVGDADWPHTPFTLTADTGPVSSFYEYLECEGWTHEHIFQPNETKMYLGFDKTADGKKQIIFSMGTLNRTTPPFELGKEFEESVFGEQSKTTVVHSPPESRYRFVMTQLEGPRKISEHTFVGDHRFMHVENKCCKNAGDNSCLHIAMTFNPIHY